MSILHCSHKWWLSYLSSTICAGKSTIKETSQTFYKMMVLPSIYHGSENWTLTKSQDSRILAAEMRFLVAGYSLEDSKKNPMYGRNWILCVYSIGLLSIGWNGWNILNELVDDCCIPKQLINCKSKGRRGVGRPKKRSRDQL